MFETEQRLGRRRFLKGTMVKIARKGNRVAMSWEQENYNSVRMYVEASEMIGRAYIWGLGTRQ